MASEFVGNGRRLMPITQSCAILSEDEWLWIRPFTRYGQLNGFIITPFKEAQEQLLKKLEKEIKRESKKRKKNT